MQTTPQVVRAAFAPATRTAHIPDTLRDIYALLWNGDFLAAMPLVESVYQLIEADPKALARLRSAASLPDVVRTR